MSTRTRSTLFIMTGVLMLCLCWLLLDLHQAVAFYGKMIGMLGGFALFVGLAAKFNPEEY